MGKCRDVWGRNVTIAGDPMSQVPSRHARGWIAQCRELILITIADSMAFESVRHGRMHVDLNEAARKLAEQALEPARSIKASSQRGLPVSNARPPPGQGRGRDD